MLLMREKTEVGVLESKSAATPPAVAVLVAAAVVADTEG